ncbi:MAG: ATP-binding protein [Thermomicrobiales bacterium]
MDVGQSIEATSVASLLRHLRLDRGWTQEELAERAGLSARGISDLERGLRRMPRRDTVELLAAALVLSADEQAQLASAIGPRVRSMPARGAGVPTTGPSSVTAGMPAPLTSFVGREREVAAVCNLPGAAHVRLVTLTGASGVGKTRLALQVARHLQDDLAGIHWVSLASATSPALVMRTIADALEIWDTGEKPRVDRLRDALRTEPLVLILDSVERVVTAAPEVADLLAHSPPLKVLATSRVPLGISGEQIFPVPPVVLPAAADADSLTSLTAAAIEGNEAVKLFVSRARSAQPDFLLTDGNAVAIATVCARLDGLPLAIELAAARIRLLPADALAARLERRLTLLTGGAQDLPPRLRTMRDAIGWSYDLLTDDGQALFRRRAICL